MFITQIETAGWLVLALSASCWHWQASTLAFAAPWWSTRATAASWGTHTRALFLILFAFSPDTWWVIPSRATREWLYLFSVSQQGLKLFHPTPLRARPARLRRWFRPRTRPTSWWTLIRTLPTWPCPACRVRKRLIRAGIAFQMKSWSLSPWSRRPAKCSCRMNRRY